MPIGGLYRYRKSGEDHQHQGNLIHLLQSAVGKGSYELYKKYSNGIQDLPTINLRDLLKFKSNKKPPLCKTEALYVASDRSDSASQNIKPTLIRSQLRLIHLEVQPSPSN